MKKTLLVTLDFYPSVGGVSTYWVSLGAYMPSKEWVVMAPLLPKGVHEMPVPYSIYRCTFLAWWCYPRWVPLLFAIAEIIYAEKIEHIIVGQILPVGTAVWLLSKFFHIPYTVSTHGMDVTLPLRSHRKRALCRRICAGATRVSTISEYTARELEKFGVSRNKIVFIHPCPALTAERYPESVESLNVHADKRILLTVGRLVARKGHADVIRALPDLFRDFPDLIYGIIGTGPEHNILQQLINALNLSHRVYLLGELDNNKTAWWYRHCTLFVMTPKEIKGDVEGFGIVYLEANSFGKAVVATRSGGVPDAVVDGRTGVLVSPGDSHSIAGAIRVLLHNDQLRTQMGEYGRDRVERDYNWRTSAEKLQKLFH